MVVVAVVAVVAVVGAAIIITITIISSLFLPFSFCNSRSAKFMVQLRGLSPLKEEREATARAGAFRLKPNPILSDESRPLLAEVLAF